MGDVVFGGAGFTLVIAQRAHTSVRDLVRSSHPRSHSFDALASSHSCSHCAAHGARRLPLLGLERHHAAASGRAGGDASRRTYGLGEPVEPTSTRASGARTHRAGARAPRRRSTSTPRDVIFAGSGTEANNLALRDAAALVVSRLDHPSIVRVAEELEGQGRPVAWVKVPRDGRLLPDAVLAAIESLPAGLQSQAVVALTLANHETGVIQDLPGVLAHVRGRGARLHVDAAQALGKLPSSALGEADSYTLVAHKIRGPQGIAALAWRGRTPSPVLLGGTQERGLRPGTLSGTLVAGFGAALERLDPDRYAAIGLVARPVREGARVRGADQRSGQPAAIARLQLQRAGLVRRAPGRRPRCPRLVHLHGQRLSGRHGRAVGSRGCHVGSGARAPCRAHQLRRGAFDRNGSMPAFACYYPWFDATRSAPQVTLEPFERAPRRASRRRLRRDADKTGLFWCPRARLRRLHSVEPGHQPAAHRNSGWREAHDATSEIDSRGPVTSRCFPASYREMAAATEALNESRMRGRTMAASSVQRDEPRAEARCLRCRARSPSVR